MRRLLHESVLQVVNFYLQIGLKQKRKGVKRPIHEEVSGADFTRATGRYSNKVRVIDRLNNRYFECVTDMQSREVIHLREEKLSEHIGRGLAKFQDHGLPHEYIANAAYFIWEKDGRIDGHDKGHWNMAIEDLKRSAAGVPAIYS
jgi:hypothetical protein